MALFLVLVGLLVAFCLWLVLALIQGGREVRRREGLSAGRTVSLDRVTLRSERLRLIGRPDRIVRACGEVIPEEWKSGRTLRPSHKAQLGVYFLLIEDQWNVVPTHGFIVLGDGSRHRIANDATLRTETLRLVEGVRAARRAVERPIPVDPPAGKCRVCGQRANCGQARA